MPDTPDFPARIAQQYVRPPNIPPSSLPAGPSSLEDSRARAIRILTDRYGDESLTEDEFEWRLAHLAAANTPESLDALVADLRFPSVPHATYPAIAMTSDFGRITSVMSAEQRSGQWALPRHLEVRAVMADIKLDLRNARIPALCTIELRAVMANVLLIVPPDLSVDFEVQSFMASARNDAFSAGPARIRVRGKAVMAEVRAKVKQR